MKIWSCAASTGEEPYSIAITACEAFGTLTPPVSIVATDVDTQVLETASRGVYAIDRVASLDASIKRKYFQRGSGPNEGKCRVIPALRQLIEYRQLNLLASRYDVGGPYAALFCRNVMIYFDKPTQRGILSRLVSHMGEDGLLYTGHSENYLHAADLIQPCGRTLYRRAPRWSLCMSTAVQVDDVMRYRDSRFQTIAAKLLPTQYLVVDDDTALTTTLGSCVAACLRDPVLKIGGMNHFCCQKARSVMAHPRVTAVTRWSC